MTALTVTCPHCGAQPDQGCLRRDGLPYGKVHNARRLVAVGPACRVRMFANTRSEATRARVGSRWSRTFVRGMSLTGVAGCVVSRTDAEVTRVAEQTAKTVLRLTSERNTARAQRDRARDIAAALEAQVAAVAALVAGWRERIEYVTSDKDATFEDDLEVDVLAWVNRRIRAALGDLP